MRPIVGLANEGDFERVMLPAGLRYVTNVWDEIYYGYINRTFAIVPVTPSPDGYLTSEVPLARIARWVNTAVSSAGTFDLRFLGLVHLSMLLVSLALLIRATRNLAPAAQWVAAGLLVLVYVDVGYVAAFNSFYPQTASLLFVLLTFGTAAEGIRRGRLTGVWLAAYFLAAALFVCSKPQEAIQAPILASWGAWLAGARPRRFWRSAAVWLGAALVAIGIWYYRQSPRMTVRYVGLFHTYFHELLQNSPDPAADMRELGIPPDLKRYVGMHAYMPESPIRDPSFQARFLEVYGFRALLGFYARHPSRLANRLARAAPAAFALRPPYLGNFEKSTGVPPRSLSHHFAAWSAMRARLGPHALVWLGIFFAGNVLAVTLAFRPTPPTERLYLSFIAVGLLMAVFEFLACSLADALDDLGRHLYAFAAICDLVLVADCVWITQLLVWRRAGTAPAHPRGSDRRSSPPSH
ncbi:MAG TPA: hypothetical protein VH854_10260 [Thermoanaerobaculia bacterium]|nr:hypothetical protein [Thermoanaerobaculia bacterium]